jgi:RimJ/RimL family protein N-acetyltransferase
MGMIAVRLRTPPTPSAAALLLRPWEAADADDMVEAYRDDALRRWTASTVDDAAGAARWIQEQQRGWETGDRFGLAVVESRESGQREPLVGHVVLKRGSPGSPSAEVGYWTAAHARGRGVAPRALEALTRWAFTAFADDGLERLELLHQVDNTASCRVARTCRYALSAVLPASPPAFPLEGHLHVRTHEPDAT